ncbi:uncharacterized protein N7515_002642 [Penicillium bovifimosum]|uniref:Uncharacterized protein n=1 Tax=Penicillium bovifimosum TaxID=126998 RepID=A0A9W9HBW9_9EURO|nr:uncharacterized protein N7515_002642 [Penicillium bovifimosum]KAJ5143855.1 hypothetical protein N7515_002642 [Penicillium bovifimosum]
MEAITFANPAIQLVDLIIRFLGHQIYPDKGNQQPLILMQRFKHLQKVFSELQVEQNYESTDYADKTNVPK